MNPTNLTEALKFLIDSSRELISLTGGNDQTVAPYWCRTINEFSSKYAKIIVSQYNNTNHKNNISHPGNITPEELRFPKIREQFNELYDLNVEDLDRPFLIPGEDGRKKVNIDWLKITSEIDDAEFDEEDTKMIMATKENKGVRIIVSECSFEEIKKGNVGCELPLSQILRAALYLDIKKGIKRPKYPYVIMYAIYNCFKFSVPAEKLSRHVLETIDDIYERRDLLLLKEKGKLDASMETVKQQIAPFLGKHSSSFGSIAGSISSGIEELNNDTIDQVAEQCHNAIKMFKGKGGEKKDLSEAIGEMLGADSEKIRETMGNVGLSTGNIRALVDNISGSMTNEELLSTVPKMDEIDSIISGLK